MKEISKLVKLFLLSTFSFSTIKHSLLKNKKEIWKPIIFILVILSLIPTYFMYIQMIKSLYLQLSMLGQQSSIFTIGAILLSLIIFIFGLSYILSTFYFSNDIERLIPMPIKEKDIIISSFPCYCPFLSWLLRTLVGFCM